MDIRVLFKEEFDIRDLCNILDKESCTIRKYERSGLINKPKNYNQRGQVAWRNYTKQEVIDILSSLLDNHKIKKCRLSNPEELAFVISFFKGEVTINDFPTLKGDK